MVDHQYEMHQHTGSYLAQQMTITSHILGLIRTHPEWTPRQIGRAAECMPEYVRAVRRRYGLVPAYKPKLTPEQRTKIAASSGTLRAVAAQYGVDASHVCRLRQAVHGPASDPVVPASVLADRDRRRDLLDRRDLTGQLMGDPPGGKSS
jgi:hypothetical protein